jgi:signal transduction histidine kinase/HD-like signal output (HDOD) protein/ActR/RegA family two-component response regulator
MRMKSKKPPTAAESSGKVREVLKRLESLPAPPAVAARVLEWITQAEPSISELCLIISSDSSLSLKVLKLASAKVHGIQRKDMKIERAASMLGTVTLKQVLLGIIIRDTLILDRRQNDPCLTQIWLHSLACALATQLLAERLAPKLADMAFSCGMVHDCGKLALLCALPGEYETLLDGAALSGQPLHVLEAAEFGLDHTEAGKWLTQSWALPALFVDSAWLHHQPEAVLADMDEHGGMLTLLALGDILAQEVLGEPLDAATSARRVFLLDGTDLSFHQVEQLKEQVARLLAERRELFSLSDEDAVATFCVALQRAGRLLTGMNAELEARRAEAERVNGLLQAVADAGRDIARAQDSGEVFARACGVLRQSFGVDTGCVYAADEERQLLSGLAWSAAAESSFAWPLEEGTGTPRPPRLDEVPGLVRPFYDLVLRRQERIPDRDDPRFPEVAPAYSRPFRIVPLSLGGAFLGELLLGAQGPEGSPARPGEAHGLGQFCGMLSAALERLAASARLETRSERLSAAMRKMQQINQKLIQAERLAAVGQLAAGAAHEINNPLAIIYARLQILGLKEPNENLRTAFRQMEEQIGRISAILTQLMDFARPTQPQFAAVELNALLENTLSMMSGSFEKHGITVHKDLLPGLPKVWADPKLLEQVFVNLFLNAEHALEGSPGALRVRSAWKGGQRHLHVDVEDTGSGIAPEHIESIFDPFFTTKEGKGTGLGLSTSYSIVKSHQGDIRVTSTLGKGTLFRVALPIAPTQQAAPAKLPHKGAGPRRSGGDILVVDDEVRIQELLREALEMHGYKVATCGNGEEALALLRKRAFNLMLLDIRMPERSGLWLLSEIRRAAYKMPVIVITGLATREERDQALDLGAIRCFQKPFKVDELLDAVDATLRQQLAARP